MQLKEAVESFLVAKKAEGKSPNTIAFYQAMLGVFMRRIEVVDLRDIKETEIREYILYLQSEHVPYGEGHPLHQPDRRLSQHSVKAHWASLSTFFNWAHQEGIIKKNPMARIGRPRTPKKLKSGLTLQEVQALLGTCKTKDGKREARDVAILLLLVDTGCRVSEVCQLHLADVDFANGCVKAYGKGAKERIVYVGRETIKAIRRYISTFRPRPRAGDWLFLTYDGRQMTRFGVASLLSRLGRAAGVSRVHAHRFRHTMAIQFLRNGGDIFSLQRLLGHTTLDTVKEYLNLCDADVEQAYRKASPVDNWKLKPNRG
jgi:integrase/recombinase XerD